MDKNDCNSSNLTEESQELIHTNADGLVPDSTEEPDPNPTSGATDAVQPQEESTPTDAEESAANTESGATDAVQPQEESTPTDAEESAANTHCLVWLLANDSQVPLNFNSRRLTKEGYVGRVVTGGRLMSLGSRKEAIEFVDAQIKRVLNFDKNVLLPVVRTMTNTIPNEVALTNMTRLLNRHLGKEAAEKLIVEITTNWDAFNAITAVANQVGSFKASQQLQIAGGAFLEQFLRV